LGYNKKIILLKKSVRLAYLVKIVKKNKKKPSWYYPLIIIIGIYTGAAVSMLSKL